tara:strand:- start:370 stop:756 length:387 start_codon:yes stop_codon:yes gene_type:complete
MIDNIQQSNGIKAFVGDLEIIGNGIAPATIEHPLSIKIKDLNVQFKFESDDSKDLKVEKKIDGKKLIMVLINFDNSLGSGMIGPEEFGFMDNRKMYISYWIWAPSTKDSKRIINWTIMQGQEEIKTDK